MSKTKNILFWFLAFFIIIFSAIYQRITGPTYPLKGKTELDGELIKYKFERSHSSNKNYLIEIKVDSNVEGSLFWGRYNFDEDFNKVSMINGNALIAEIPKQPPAGKIEYFIELKENNKKVFLPENKTVVIKFKGDVPGLILIPHVLMMFLSMLFSNRAAFEYSGKTSRVKIYSLLTIITLLVDLYFRTYNAILCFWRMVDRFSCWF